MPSITEVFNTDGMRYSWELLTKFTIIADIVQFFLTVYGLLSMVACLLRVSASIFYLSNRKKFDEIDRIQSEGFSNAFRTAQGFNKIIVAFYCILPNMKNLSDCGSSQFNIDEDDSIVTYMARTSLNTILIITFSAMAANGLLFQIYANVAEGMLAVAKQARDLQIAKSVDEFFNSGKEYQFTLKHYKNKEGDVKYKVARSMYVDIVNRSGLTDSTTKTMIGSNIESKLTGNGQFDNAVKSACASFPEIGKWVADANGTKGRSDKVTVYDVINLSVAPSSYAPDGKKGGGPRAIGKSGSIFVPIGYVTNVMKEDPSFAGYLVTVSYKIPRESKFKVKAK